MKWFGESWGAPICEGMEPDPIPLGRPCMVCEKTFLEGDQGIILPFVGGPDEPALRGEAPYHIECFRESVGVSPYKFDIPPWHHTGKTSTKPGP